VVTRSVLQLYLLFAMDVGTVWGFLPESDADTIRLAGMVLVAMRWAGPWECVSSIGDVSIVAFGT